MASSTGFSAIRRTLGHPSFAIYVAGNGVSLIGTWVQRIAIGWLTWTLTESGAWLGAVAFADLFPAVVIGPIGGVFADRVSRIRVIRIAQMILMLQALTLFALTATDLITIWAVVGLALVNGVVIGFNQAARLALVPSLVPRADLSTAVAINAITFNLARFIGPALAGALIVTWGTAPAFGVNGLSYLAFLFALSRLRPTEEVSGDRRSSGKRSLFGDIADGLRYAASHAGIGTLLFLMLGLSLGVRPLIELMAGFAADVFGGGAEALALLSAVLGVGAIAGGIWLALGSNTTDRAGLVMLATGVTTLATLCFAAIDNLYLALPFVAVTGFCLVVCGVSTQTLLQLAVDGTMRGRVLSLYGLIFRGGPALGALAMGAASEVLGLQLPLAIGSVAVLLLLFWAWRRLGAVSAAFNDGGSP
jgi:predicted MFS family arabinose efflux permease